VPCWSGLVYKHYGREIIARLAKLPKDHPDVETVYLQVRGKQGHGSVSTFT